MYSVLVPYEVRHHPEGGRTADEKDDLESEKDGLVPTVPLGPTHHDPINDRVGPHRAGPRRRYGGVGRQFGGGLWR